MPALYAAMDVFVLGSHREGLSKSLLEATAMARPTVTCDIRGCREIVVDGDTGLLAPVRDAAALTESVLALQQDESRRRRMGAAGRQRILALYTESIVAQRVLDVYGALAPAPPRRCFPTHPDRGYYFRLRSKARISFAPSSTPSSRWKSRVAPGAIYSSVPCLRFQARPRTLQLPGSRPVT